MEEYIYFSNFVTKSLQPINSEDRYFEGYLTVQVKDKQGEITIVDELYKVLPIWMDRGAPISDTHSNRIIGKGINYAKTEYIDKDGTKYPAIKITGKIHKNYELDNEIWQKIKSGEYKGLSFGGATRTSREPVVMKDGSIAYALKELEHYEVAVCKDPAVPLALITDHNSIAKAMAGHTEDRGDKMLIQCSKFGCYINKGKNFDAKTGKLNLEKPNEGDGTQAMLDPQNKVIATGGNKQLEEIKRLQSGVKKDSLIKIEDEEDENTKATVLDEWKNETDPDTKKSQEIGTANAGGTRFSGKEYNQGEETTQITKVPNSEEDEEKKDQIVNKILPALGAISRVIGRGIVGGIANTAASSGGASDDEKVDDTKNASYTGYDFDDEERKQIDKTHQRNAEEDEMIGEMEYGDKKIPRSRVANDNDISDLGDDLESKFSTGDDGAMGRAATISVLNAKKLKAGIGDVKVSHDDKTDSEKEKEQKDFADIEEREGKELGSGKDVNNSLLHKADVKKAFMIVEKIVPLIAQAILPMLTGDEEEVEKADLSKLSTFKGKEQALIDEGKSKESAEKIVGSFVKHENKADASVTTSTEGVNNPVYSDKEKKKIKQLDPNPEDDNPENIMNRANIVGTKPYMYKSQEKEIEETAGLSHANTHGDGNQGSQNVGIHSWAGSGSPYPKIINESRNNKIKSINLDCNILKNKLKRI